MLERNKDLLQHKESSPGQSIFENPTFRTEEVKQNEQPGFGTPGMRNIRDVPGAPGMPGMPG